MFLVLVLKAVALCASYAQVCAPQQLQRLLCGRLGLLLSQDGWHAVDEGDAAVFVFAVRRDLVAGDWSIEIHRAGWVVGTMFEIEGETARKQKLSVFALAAL